MAEMGWRGLRLVARSRDASDEAIQRVDRLIDDYFDFVWRQLRRRGLAAVDADDAAQEVFVIAARKIEVIDAGQERSFLYGTALRVARNARRSQRRRRAATGAVVQTHEFSAPSPEAAMEAERARALLDELLGLLPEELRRVLVLAEIEELSAPRIAELEGIPIGTVASRLRRARQRFRELVEAAADRNPFGGSP